MKQHLVHLGIAFSVFAGACIGFYLWEGVVTAKSDALAVVEDKIATRDQEIKQSAEARSILNELEGEEARIQGYFVPEISTVPFINNLEARGRALGASVVVSSVAKGGTSAEPMLVLSLTVKGSFDAVMRTVGSIEYAPYNSAITSLYLGHDDKNSWHADVKLTVGSVAPTKTAP